MDHMRILRRSWNITWAYRALWVFGFILALTMPHGGGGGGGGSRSASLGFPSHMTAGGGLRWFDPIGTQETALIIAMAVVALLIAAILIAAHEVAQVSVIRMVDRFEVTGERTNVWAGFRLGWSRAALRLFLIDLLLLVGVLLLIALIFAVAGLPLLSYLTRSDVLRGFGTAGSIALFAMALVLLLAVIVIVVVAAQFIHRACVLEDLGVFAAMRRGWAVMRRRPSDVAIMAVVLFALSLAAAFVLIPIFFVLAMMGFAAGGVPGAVIGLIVSLFAGGSLPWIVGMGVAVPIFLLVVIVPLVFLSGLAEVFGSSAWTLTYRELNALGA